VAERAAALVAAVGEAVGEQHDDVAGRELIAALGDVAGEDVAVLGVVAGLPDVVSALTLVTAPPSSVATRSGSMCDAFAKRIVPRGSNSAAKHVIAARSAPGCGSRR
jgi:hypothetical protein